MLYSALSSLLAENLYFYNEINNLQRINLKPYVLNISVGKK